MMRDGQARKVRSEKRLRRHKTETRLNDAEFAHLRKLCKIANASPGVVIRTLLMGNDLKPARIYPEDVYRAIVGLGRNWNQAVTKLHATGHIPTPLLETVLAEIRELCACLYSS